MFKVVPYSEMRYPTVGDWTDDGDIIVADTGNPDYNFLIALHEFVEWYGCKRNGLEDATVTSFDKSFEGNEPGDDPAAPYSKYHQQASIIEHIAALQLGVDWDEYEKAVEKTTQ